LFGRGAEFDGFSERGVLMLLNVPFDPELVAFGGRGTLLVGRLPSGVEPEPERQTPWFDPLFCGREPAAGRFPAGEEPKLRQPSFPEEPVRPLFGLFAGPRFWAFGMEVAGLGLANVPLTSAPVRTVPEVADPLPGSAVVLVRSWLLEDKPPPFLCSAC
jgi:hypothetical protein